MSYSEATASSEPDSNADQRRGQRRLVNIEALIKLPCGRTVPASIVDITAGGVGVRWDESVISGTRMHLSAGRLSHRSVIVAWVRNGGIGLRFDEPLSFQELCTALPGVRTAVFETAKASGPEGANSDPAPTSRQLLKTVHQHLLEAIIHLENCADTDAPSVGAVLKARSELSQAERQRRIAVQSIIVNSVDSGSVPVAAFSDHKRLRTELDNLRTNYVRSWTPDAMQADWKGYCEARAEKCRILRDSIRHEQLLFKDL